jgi:hypothetical protein
MTKFTKENLSVHAGYIQYQPHADSYYEGRKFVARFKYAKDGVASFKAFLIKNFTVEEYFAQLDAGVAPLKIVEEKGYLLPHIKTWLKRDGYPVTKAGFDQYIQDRIDTRKAA